MFGMMINYFKEWRETHEEKKAFMEMWGEEFGKEFNSSNACTPYHKKVAYELFKLEKRLIELENTVKNETRL